MSNFFADTFALFEIAKGNAAYIPYIEKRVVTSKMNLLELYYALLRTSTTECAERFFNTYVKRSVDITNSSIKMAALYRYFHKSESLSYIDCLGWARANELGIPFLTGDCKFKNKPNVAFVR